MKFEACKPEQSRQIIELFTDVFTDSEGAAEGALISRLVLELINNTQDEDIYGFVASDNEQVIGSIFFTRLTFTTPIQAFIMAPVAVDTSQQGKGIGQGLINYGIERLRADGVKLVCTYGDPDFYSKTGFRPISEDIIQAPRELSQPEGWLCQSLDGGEIAPVSERPRCVSALDKAEYW